MVVDSSGASAGVTYGAHGVWNWQTSRSQGSVLGEGFDMPFRWQECLQFAGVWDFGAIEHVLASLGATAGDDALAVVPAQELLDDAREAIRVARVAIASHVPAAHHGAQVSSTARVAGRRRSSTWRTSASQNCPSVTTVTAPCAWRSIPLSTTLW